MVVTNDNHYSYGRVNLTYIKGNFNAGVNKSSYMKYNLYNTGNEPNCN